MTNLWIRTVSTFRGIVLALLLCSGRSAMARQGECLIHDPSTIVTCAGKYWVYGTGNGICSRSSTDGSSWTNGPNVFQELPSWVHTLVPGNTGVVWAPDVKFFNHQYYLYYAVSTFGSNVSAIGLATSPTLDPTSRAYRWTDQGAVIQSSKTDNFNAIDPCVLEDATGKMWLAFGSFWSGIKLIQLNPRTGKRISPESPIFSLAQRPSPDAMEAPYIVYHSGYYYLFVNWDLCCRGVNSTYNIRVGRSAAVIGPYVDKDGVPMLQGGGTLFLAAEGNQIGPGCVGVLHSGGQDRISYHFYDGKANGRPTMGIRTVEWAADGWPAAGRFWP